MLIQELLQLDLGKFYNRTRTELSADQCVFNKPLGRTHCVRSPARLDGGKVLARDLSKSRSRVVRGVGSGILRDQQIENTLSVGFAQGPLIFISDPVVPREFLS